ncbi:MAG TPA: EboA domain-containing protein, partial [Acidimicrobiia bacterium]|nr:EboA domain-containing protein [Acidimicrobiia bacterium]
GVLEPAPPGGPLFRWTADDAARAGLLDALGAASAEIEGLYRHGDTAERRAVLRWIGLLPDGHPLAAPATELVEDALRANDPRLVAAALGPWAIRNLEAPVLRPAVLKCVSLGIPLSGLAELGQRGGPELARVLAGHAHEQIAAGRAVPDDIWPLVHRHPPADVLAAIEAELEHPVAARRRAARSALDASSAAVAQSRRC